jgi:alpha,alpha-trehalose phosphorylase
MKKCIIREQKKFEEKSNALYETLFSCANGYLGIRGCLEEGVPDGWNTMRGMYINGFYDVIPMKQAENLCNFIEKKETMVNVADLQTIRLRVCGEPFDLSAGTILSNRRILNMEEGYTLRDVTWCSPGGKKLQIQIKRMASFEKLTLFTMEYRVTPLNFSGNVQLESMHIADVRNYSNPADPRLAAESLQNLQVISMETGQGRSISVGRTSESGLRMCAACGHHVKITAENQIKEQSVPENSSIRCSLSSDGKTESCFLVQAKVTEKEQLILEKYCVLTDSIRYADVQKAAAEDLQEALLKGLSYYEEAQRQYLARFWNQCEMEIDGDESMNNAVAFNMYQLLQSAAKDSHCSVAAKGLSGEGYEGHYFWDTEMFILPFFILTNPDMARMLLSYRYDTLDKARENAKLLGHRKGALFPWRTITGVECSGYFPSGTAQYHIDSDIAYAVIQYYLTTGDLDFIEEKGAEIVLETARLWMDTGNYAGEYFVINDVTGPDEYTCMVNNNYYTNCGARYNLAWAVRFMKILQETGRDRKLSEKLKVTEEELCRMQEASDRMLLPYDQKLGINPQDDSFLQKPRWELAQTPKENFPLLLHYHPLHLYRYQVCKQADTVLAYFLYETEQSIEVMKRSYQYYEAITTHDSSLSTCVFSIVASRLGMEEKGYSYFGHSAEMDLENTHNNTKDGIHTANMGGCYMAIVNGFAGLRINTEGISIAPFLPPDWNKYRFKLRYRGSLLQVEVRKGRVTVSVLEGKEVKIRIWEHFCRIMQGEKVEYENQSSHI